MVLAGQEPAEPRDWAETLRVVHGSVFDRAPNADDPPTVWRALLSATARLVDLAVREDKLRDSGAGLAWQIVDAIAAHPLLWVDERVDEVDLEGALTLALNSPAGEVTGAAIALALSEYRQAKAGDPDKLADTVAAIGDGLVVRLDQILSGPEDSRVPPEVMFGQYLPQLHLLVADWIAAHAAKLFTDGATAPGRHPAWGAYLARATLYDSVFVALRPWYVQAARVADRIPDGERFSVAEGLARHLLIAVLRGLARPGDSDHLLEDAFDKLPGAAKASAYWSVFRSWSDHDEAPPPAFVDRIVAFWGWRLERLDAPLPVGKEEATGLSWLMRTPYIEVKDLVRLGPMTTRLAQGDIHLHNEWSFLSSWLPDSPEAVFAVVDTVVRSELKKPHPYVSTNALVPLMEALLAAAEQDLRARVVRLINDLGEEGYSRFGELL